jgi:hypothetical protein
VPALAFGATIAAVTGWTRDPASRAEKRWITIRDVRPLHTDDPNLRNLITHTYAVRVSIAGWGLLPYRPGASADSNRPDAGHWRLYLNGHSLGDEYGDTRVSYTTYLPPGTHWIAAELSNADGTSLRPSVWSEPVLLHVPGRTPLDIPPELGKEKP